MSSNSPFIFKNYTELSNEQHKIIIEARNNPTVRLWIFKKEIISFEQHLSFVDSLKHSSDKVYYAAYKDDVYYGSVNLTGLDTEKPFFGFFVSPDFFGTKNGVYLYYYGVDFFFQKYSFLNIYGMIFKNNKKAIKIAYKFGISEYEEKGELIAIATPSTSWPANLTPAELNQFIMNKKSVTP